MKIIIVIRQDQVWSRQYFPSSFYTKVFRAELVIDTWNSLFNIPYHEFRIALHEIQKVNLADIQADLVVYENDPKMQGLLRDENNLILPIDDDDWFDPNICCVLKSAQFGRFIRWHYLRYFYGNSVQLAKHPFPTYLFDYQSNNYAFRTPANWDMYGHDGSANDNIPRAEETYLEQILSVHNFNPSSLSGYFNQPDVRDVMVKSYRYFDCEQSEQMQQMPSCFHKYSLLMFDLWKRLKLLKML
ncbi:MAG: hypothetical protein M0R80_01780 [Proteobacteria bacterium]|jgi:hypothetical protein|nr:hypothetical protein [Pseudomonadota bacterium]